MGCQSNNATAPAPGIAPGGEGLDPRRCAEDVARSHGGLGIDPRIPGAVPDWDAPFFQAGLAGYSDAAMRIIARRHGCPACVTEALLDRTLLAGGRGFAKADLGELHDNVPGGDEDAPLVGQIMGSEPAEMAAAALKMLEQDTRGARAYRDLAYEDITQHKVRESLEEHDEIERVAGSFAAIDVNLACPVKKIAKKARGGHWLAEPAGAIRILEAVREAVPAHVPVTVKMRRSFDDTPEMVESFWKIFDAAYDMGCSWVTVHGRTVEQKYVGPSRWDLLKEIREARPERVILGSGDIWEAGDIFRMMAYTGLSGVSVARGCIGNPWIFRQARDLMAGREPSLPTIAEQRKVLEDHFALAMSVNRSMVRSPESHTGKTMRKFGIRFAQHHPRSEEVRLRMIAVSTLADWRAVLDDLYTEE
ncbi:MAG: tRNA-dihydrouridine synthase family protein [Phycisphaerales bacterium]|nr:tRNA-dihydrouridine synthase family protein [Phycisphaerales bacterium]MCB9836107.1 tRNA-dihydrouridine synthase family protein [Phycisphaera sp.]